MLREKVADGAISKTDTVMWKHREWGYVAVTDIVKVDHEAEGDAGLYGCCALVPAKFVPKENAEGSFTFTIKSVSADKKISAIKAMRVAQAGLGLKEAKDIIDSCPIISYTGISSGTPYVATGIRPSQIGYWRDAFKDIGVDFMIEPVGDVGDMYTDGDESRLGEEPSVPF